MVAKIAAQIVRSADQGNVLHKTISVKIGHVSPSVDLTVKPWTAFPRPSPAALISSLEG